MTTDARAIANKERAITDLCWKLRLLESRLAEANDSLRLAISERDKFNLCQARICIEQYELGIAETRRALSSPYLQGHSRPESLRPK